MVFENLGKETTANLKCRRNDYLSKRNARTLCTRDEGCCIVGGSVYRTPRIHRGTVDNLHNIAHRCLAIFLFLYLSPLP